MARALLSACGIALVVAAFFACSEDEERKEDAGTESDGGTGESGTFVEEDAGFQGITATVDGVEATYTEQRAAYGSSAGELTTLRAFRDPSPPNAGHGVILTIDAERPGSYPCGVPGSTMALYRDDGQEIRYGALTFDEDGGLGGSCTIEITTYGAIAEFIEGTFSGTLLKTAGPPSAPPQIVVTNGRFRLRRNLDE